MPGLRTMSYTEIFSQFGPNSGYVQQLYELYKTDPALVGESWANFFNGLDSGQPSASISRADYSNGANGQAAHLSGDTSLQERANRLTEAFRSFGHFSAKINPLSKDSIAPPSIIDLDIEKYGFSQAELGSTVTVNGFGSISVASLIALLKSKYCDSIGFEYRHLADDQARSWLCQKIENNSHDGAKFEQQQKIEWLRKLVDAETFEAELHKKYVGHKRFSLEGGDTLIPMLDTLLQECASSAVSEVVIGMAHRGRLNVLANTLGKPLEDIFSEFEDQNIFTALGSGDVKYHLGYQSDYNSRSGKKIKLHLAPNPSHLEFVNPVVEGMARAKQDIEHDSDRVSVLPVLIHGDAAMAGQGVVFETLQMSGVDGYATGGTIHIVINNQVGFTTDPQNSRSSYYCTSMAKAVEAPVFHVNSEDVEAACWSISLALEYRNRFKRDVVLDLYCYRKYGHNEGDDPSFTQPVIYTEIKDKAPTSKIFGPKLVAQGVISGAEVDNLYEDFRARFKKAHEKSKKLIGEACAMHGRLRETTVKTGVSKETLLKVGESLLSYPQNFVVHPKLFKILEKRVQTLRDGKGIDWGFAEGLAFGALVAEGCAVRLSGQDCGRGTFSQRHLALTDFHSSTKFLPFSVFNKGTSKFEVYNSILSEAGVLGFEFGYSSIAQDSLVLWEAQFGDFANGAQVIIDQFISSSEQKWNQLAGVVMLLPHGYEGQGPEHSSARLERYLQLCADGNMFVCVPSSAAQHFHMLRRQAKTSIKRPLIVMTPKSLLRSSDAASDIEELINGQFNPVLEDDFSQGAKASHVVLCSGKVYYDLAAALRKLDKPKVRLLRLEQLYPFPEFELKKILKSVSIKSCIWVQEEPQNMGAWTYVEPYLRDKLGCKVTYIGRPSSASTATGSGKRHAKEQAELVSEMIKAVSA